MKCDNCNRERGDDERDYNPVDLLLRRPTGWYSGEDGEVCGDCMIALFQRANGR